ncbi:hypothetical protein I545_1895 [Mycobacterium kansasii 662]|uniref:Uncharacterized protein n=1 Tax=Mycobacterium kansasii 662 TaxID=1299326 RepID=X7ZJP1_MYCKA|nr:hypothetical protein I547_3688 [Mycobacterium kansasii 824]EUA19782.1 hypothetical protein I545_1895 [Mycobacterium kansasii 662]KEP39933.1 hypothetical protein MKSMC1_49810 [Mycobacterium kansasii]
MVSSWLYRCCGNATATPATHGLVVKAEVVNTELACAATRAGLPPVNVFMWGVTSAPPDRFTAGAIACHSPPCG